MGKRLRTGYSGTVDSVGWTLRRTGKSADVYAVVEIRLGNERGGRSSVIERAEKRIEALQKQLVGNRVQLFQV